MSSLTQHHCHSHRAEHPYGQGGDSNYLEERGDRDRQSKPHHRGEAAHGMEKADDEQYGNMHPVGFFSFCMWRTIIK